MLKRFLRWSWAKPLARRILKNHGKAILLELVKHVPMPKEAHDKIGALGQGLTRNQLVVLSQILECLQLIDQPEAKTAAEVLRKIINILK